MIRSYKSILILLAAVVLLLGSISWGIHEKITTEENNKVRHSLITVRDTTHLAVKTWFRNQTAAATIWADATEVRQAAKQLLATPSNSNALLASPVQSRLRDWFEPLQKVARYQGYFIVGPNNINLASSRDQNIGVENLLSKQTKFFDQIWSGNVTMSLPAESDVPLPDRDGVLQPGLPSMFVGAPIFDDAGQIIAAFMIRLNPAEGFSDILQQGRIGESGETYAFDHDGLLISHSRFDDQLRSIGLVDSNRSAILNIQLRDPGVNLLDKQQPPREQQALTRMAASAISGQSGVDSNGYRDYRGVPVVGAWLWDPELGIGIATELNLDEAYQTLHVTQLTIITHTLLIILLLVGSTTIYIVFHQRARAETALREKDALFRALVEGVGQEHVLFRQTLDGRYQYATPAIESFTGIPVEKALGQKWYEMFDISPETREKLIASEAKRIQVGVTQPYELTYVHPEGTRRTVEISERPEFDNKGKPVAILGILKDITQRKQFEDALRKNEQYNRMLFEQSPIGLALCRMNGDLVDVNPSFASILGRTVEETLPLSYWEITPEKYFAQEQLQLESLEQTCRYGPYEKEYIHKDGHLVAVQLTGQLLEKDGEKFIWSSVEDITKRKRTENQLRQAATVFENTDEGIIITDADKNIILVNQSFTKITGYQAEEAIGKNPRIQQSGHHQAEFYDKIWQTVEEKGQWRGEIWNRRKNGEVYPAWENISAVKDQQNRLINYVAVFSDISVIKESETRLTYLAHHDTLTGLPNRLRLIANLEQALESAKRHHSKAALMYLDLDGFKYFNDSLGHALGDELLQTTATRLQTCVRAEDTVARLGGDEFTVLLPEVSHAEDAGIIAEKIIEAVREPVLLDGRQISTSISVGISIYPDDAIDSQTLLKAADAAMYHAKSLGRNNFQFYTPDITSKAMQHLVIENELRRGLEQQEFVLFYQPQISVQDGCIVGVEALIRWQHPQRGLLLPENFISVADDTSLIDPISEWVMHTACADLTEWEAKGSAHVRMAINISGRQITNAASISQILSFVEQCHQSYNALELDLEITETALDEIGHSMEIIHKLKQRGVMFVIDDFGTGHSSLSRLKQLPIDTLKIDRSFVESIDKSPDDKAIASAIIAMAHNLNLHVIAEGVETKEQLTVLETLGCDEIQGFYYSEPIPAAQMARLLEQQPNDSAGKVRIT